MNTSVKPPRKRKVTPDKVYNRLRRTGKGVYHLLKYDHHQPKTILFIVGCQRSGTTLMNRIFERDLRAKVYPEVSKLSSEDPPRQLRLNPLPKVKAVLDKDRAPLIILKPLVESQNTLQLLDYFEGSKALWLYRDYKAVALSHVRKWGNYNSINDLKAIVEARPNNWRYENVSAELRNIVLQYFVEDMDPYDASALYWFVRNSLFFELNLDKNPKVFICRYEDLVFNPIKVMKNVYKFLDHDFPGSQITKEVTSKAVQRGKHVVLSSGIDCLCRQLLEKLDKVQHHPIQNDFMFNTK